MKQTLIKIYIFLFAVMITRVSTAQVEMNFKFDTPYGNNREVGKYTTVNGAKIYYEEYGKGQPLLLIHGNGGSIRDMGNQIGYFKSKYRVIIADNRGHGKSELKTDSLTYVQITKDYEALAKHLHLDSLNIIGWSDGGIIGLLLGINNKLNINKIVAMGANLRPDSTAVYPWAVNEVKRMMKEVKTKIAENGMSKELNLQKQHLFLLGDQPSITTDDLTKIKAKVLIIAGDKDIIREEHTVEIYQHIPNAQLCILPGETHYIPASNPALFNEIVGKFLEKPFQRPDSDWTKW